jgi:hypothetical protein
LNRFFGGHHAENAGLATNYQLPFQLVEIVRDSTQSMEMSTRCFRKVITILMADALVLGATTAFGAGASICLK